MPKSPSKDNVANNGLLTEQPHTPDISEVGVFVETVGLDAFVETVRWVHVWRRDGCICGGSEVGASVETAGWVLLWKHS